MVDDELVNFPVLIEVVDANLSTKAQSSGDDIVFTDGSGIQLHHEIEYYENTSGHLVAWVNVSSLSSSSDTVLYMYYGNPGCENLENVSGTWDSDYRMIQHLEETSGVHVDSSGFGNNGSCTNGVVQDASGQCDGADGFDGDDDYINCGADSSLDFGTSTDFTLEAWVKNVEPPTGSEYQRIVNIDPDTTGVVSLYTNADGRLRFQFASTSTGHTPVDGDIVRDGEWHYVVAVFDRDYGGIQSWVDDTKQNDVSVDLSSASADGYLCIGKKPDYTSFPDCWHGSIDEVRVSSIIRNSSWINATYHCIQSPGLFMNISSEEIAEWPDEPVISSPSPSNNLHNIQLNPVLSITVFDGQGDSMDVYFRSNASGSWQTLGSNLSVGNGTYRQDSVDMDEFDTVYWWSVNATDDGSGNWTNQTFSFRTLSGAPIISYESPEDSSTFIELNATLSIDVVDLQGNDMDVCFRSNASGSWQMIGSNVSVGNGTYRQTTDMDGYNTTYWWSVNCSDGLFWTNETYKFTTIPDAGVFIENIEYTFEGASLKSLTQLGHNSIGFEVDDSQSYVSWFYFNITQGALDQTVEFQQQNGGYYHKCVYSYDGETWYRFAESQPTWSHTFTNDSVLVAWTFPYQYSFLESYLDEKDALSLPFYNRSVIGQSVEGRNMEMVTITNFSVPLCEKEVIWVITGQHPSEKNSQRQTWYMMDFLLNETNVTAAYYRDNYLFKIFPMMNPDGIYHGYTRYNANLQDLNRDWDDGPGNYEPEIDVVFGYLKDWLNEGKDIDIFIDQHGFGGYNIWTVPSGYVNARVYANVHDFADYLTTDTLYPSWGDNWYSGRSMDVLPADYNITALTPENRPQSSTVTLEDLRLNALAELVQFDRYLSDSLNVSAIAPVNGSVADVLPVVFEYNVSSSLYDVEEARLYVDDVLVMSNVSPVSLLETNNFTTVIAPGVHRWYVVVEDSIGNVDESCIRMISYFGETPYSFNVSPLNDADDVSVLLDQLNFTIADPQGELMSYTVGTTPDIGFDAQSGKINGTYHLSVSGLNYNTLYTWFVNVSDGTHWTNQTYSFTTERNDTPQDLFNPFEQGWQYRKQITINHSLVPDDLNGFPVYLNLTDSDLALHTQLNGEDLLFMDGSGVASQLPHEIEYYDHNTGHYIVWVNASHLSSTEDTVLYLYYGNSGCSNQENVSGTWDSRYRLVQHLAETSGTHLDSTLYGNDGSCVGGVDQDVLGMCDGADRFDGVDDYIDCGNDASLNFADALTVEAWVRLDAKTDDSRVVLKYNGDAGWILWYDVGEDCWTVGARDGDIGYGKFTQSSPVIGDWYHVVGVYDGSEVSIFVDGVLGAVQESLSSMSASPDNLFIGKEFVQGFMDGVVDEVRVSSIARNISWIQTQYYNQYNTSDFYDIGPQQTSSMPVVFNESPADGSSMILISLSELRFNLSHTQGSVMNYTVETSPYIGGGVGQNVSNDSFSVAVSDLDYSTIYTWFVNVSDGSHWVNESFGFSTEAAPVPWWDSSWEYRKMISVNHSLVADDLTDFPVLISMVDSDLASHAMTDAADIVFTDNAGIKLAHEVEYFDDISGELVAWVNVTSLSDSMDTVLYMYYGNPSCAPQENMTGVWDSQYKLVQHLNETSGIHEDSTVYGNDGTCYGGLDQDAAGMVDGADGFDGTDDKVNCGNHVSLGITDEMTIETWVKIGEIYSNWRRIIAHGISSAAGYQLITHDTEILFARCDSTDANDGTFRETIGASLAVDAWYHVVVVYDGTFDIYVNGVSKTLGAGDFVGYGTGNDLLIGSRSDGYGFNGVIDEVRISNVSRSSGWISTEYHNQLNPSSFCIVGSEESQGPAVAPEVTSPDPFNGATDVSILLSELSFNLSDPQGDLMNYTVETSPYIGEGVGQNVTNGTYHLSVSGLTYDTVWVFEGLVE